MIGVYVPTLGRPGALQQLAGNLREMTDAPYTLVFVVEPHDQEAHEAAVKVEGARLLINPYAQSYSNALQHAYEMDDEPFFIAANDDFEFQQGWDTPALEILRDNPDVHVVGLYDGNPHTDFSTIALVRRSYIEYCSGVVDMPRRVQFPYQHNFVDTEFHRTAVSRGVFQSCRASQVWHIHPDFGHGQYDKTYQLGRSSFSEDSALFASRAHLWSKT